MINKIKKFFSGCGGMFLGIVLAIAIVCGFAAWAINYNKNYEAKVLNQSTEHFRTLHTGDPLAFSCEGKSFFIELMETSPNKVGILEGYYGRNTANEVGEVFYKMSPDQPKTIVAGCYKVVIVKDPHSYYMLEIYRKPGP
jgi:hypothetical protein